MAGDKQFEHQDGPYFLSMKMAQAAAKLLFVDPSNSTFQLPSMYPASELSRPPLCAVGAILYEMVVGYPPFFSDDAVTTCQKIVNWRKYLKYPDGVSLLPSTFMKTAGGGHDNSILLASCHEYN